MKYWKSLLGSCCVFTFAIGIAASTIRAQSSPQFDAIVAGNTVFASFDLQPQTTEDLDARLSKQAPTIVIWTVDLKRATPLKDRAIASALIRVSARHANGSDMYLLARSVNGVSADEGVMADRQSAVAWLTSFPRVPLFERYQLAGHVVHRLTISAILEGGEAPRVVTSTLARANLEWD
jgi:hypothetical protein